MSSVVGSLAGVSDGDFTVSGGYYTMPSEWEGFGDQQVSRIGDDIERDAPFVKLGYEFRTTGMCPASWVMNAFRMTYQVMRSQGWIQTANCLPGLKSKVWCIVMTGFLLILSCNKSIYRFFSNRAGIKQWRH